MMLALSSSVLNFRIKILFTCLLVFESRILYFSRKENVTSLRMVFVFYLLFLTGNLLYDMLLFITVHYSCTASELAILFSWIVFRTKIINMMDGIEVHLKIIFSTKSTSSIFGMSGCSYVLVLLTWLLLT